MKCLRPFRTKNERPNFDGVRNRKPRPTENLDGCFTFVSRYFTFCSKLCDENYMKQWRIEISLMYLNAHTILYLWSWKKERKENVVARAHKHA